MKFSRKTIYALIFLVAIAKKGENGNITLKEAAEKEDISLKYLEQIGNILCKAGFINSWRGPNGGYRLARPADSIKAGEIVLDDGTVLPLSKYRAKEVKDKFIELVGKE